MRIVRGMFILVLIVLHSLPSYGGEVSPGLSEKLQAIGASSMVSVIVRMSIQANLKNTTEGMTGRNKPVRLKKVIQSLKKTALERQGSIIEIIKKEQVSGFLMGYS